MSRHADRTPERPFWIVWARKDNLTKPVLATTDWGQAKKEQLRIATLGHVAGLDPIADHAGRMPQVPA